MLSINRTAATLAATDEMDAHNENRIRVAIDRGGTFTDVHAIVPGQEDIVLKLLSLDPSNYADAPTEAIRQVLEQATRKSLPRGEPIDLSPISSIRMGTTVATNALLERKGERSALLITKGFKDLLVIGNQARPDIFDLTVRKPGVLYEKVIEVNERVTLEGFTEDPEKKVVTIGQDPDLVVGLSREVVRILQRPDLKEVQQQIQSLYDDGFRSLSICFAHSYTYPQHELDVAKLAQDMGMSVSLSSQLQPMVSFEPCRWCHQICYLPRHCLDQDGSPRPVSYCRCLSHTLDPKVLARLQ